VIKGLFRSYSKAVNTIFLANKSLDRVRIPPLDETSSAAEIQLPHDRPMSSSGFPALRPSGLKTFERPAMPGLVSTHSLITVSGQCGSATLLCNYCNLHPLTHSCLGTATSDISAACLDKSSNTIIAHDIAQLTCGDW
jgi:hypothetical protein